MLMLMLCHFSRVRLCATPIDGSPPTPPSLGFSRQEHWSGLDLLTAQGTLKSLLQYHSSKASILWLSAFFTVQLSHPYMTTGKTIALTRWTFVGKIMSLLLNMLSRLVITFLPKSQCLLISWLQSPSAVQLKCHFFSKAFSQITFPPSPNRIIRSTYLIRL